MSDWYIAKIAPGTSRLAAELEGEPYCHADRKDETVVERKIRDAGFECWTPRMKVEVENHRTHKMAVRTLLVFPTYTFVALPTANAEWLSKCKAVSYVLGCDLKAGRLNAKVEEMRAAEANMEFDDTKESRRFHKQPVHEYVPGARIHGRHNSSIPGYYGLIKSTIGKTRVSAMIETINGLVAMNLPIAQIELAA